MTQLSSSAVTQALRRVILGNTLRVSNPRQSQNIQQRWGNAFSTLSDNDLNCHRSSPNVRYAPLSKPGGIYGAQLSSLSSDDIKGTSCVSLIHIPKLNGSILSQGNYRSIAFVVDFFPMMSYAVSQLSPYLFVSFSYFEFVTLHLPK